MTHYEWLKYKIEYLKQHPTDECIPWPFSLSANGYGQVWDPETKRLRLVHRISYLLFNGEPPKGIVRHMCHYPPCFNSLHLKDGTSKDNAQDALDHGVLFGPRKLTEEEVIHILELLNSERLTTRQIAEIFNISQPTISMIKNNRIWKHIPRPKNDPMDVTDKTQEEAIDIYISALFDFYDGEKIDFASLDNAIIDEFGRDAWQHIKRQAKRMV